MKESKEEMGKNKKGRRKEKGRKEWEEKVEEVEKDVTGWTLVMRNRRQRKMVQIFVKVNGSKATPMEVNLTDDKVEGRDEADPERRGRVCDNARESAEENRKAEEL